MSTARRYCPWNDINLRPPPPPGVAGWLSSPSPPRRAPAQWVRRSGGECECGIAVAPMPPPRPNPTPAHPSAHPPSFDDPETETSASNKTSASNETSASNDEDEDDAMGRRCRDLPPRARGTRHGADATSAMACDPSSAGASRPTISSFPMCRSSPPPSCPPPTGVGA